MNDTVTEFPGHRSDRWEPTRAGLVALWRYWDETFTFHRGRLLLRGPNGSGKSMALELLLPFVLDADASPARLTSAAKSRGGLYERIMTGTDDPTRAGFAWVEFRRGAGVFTAGVRLRASTSTRKVDHDFFTTSQAVGHDLFLLDERREPLTRKALAEAIGANGRVHATGADHRAAVRDALFPGYGADRYDSLITALLALRQEKLSQNLDLAKLSEVLSEALPAIDEHDLAAVAEGFERLDRRRADLAGLEAEVQEVRSLAARQRTYARSVLAGVALRVRTAETQRDRVTKDEREATVALDDARAEGASVARDLDVIVARLEEVDGELDALRSSAAYQEGGQLADLRKEAHTQAAAVGRARVDAEAGETARQEAAGDCDTAEQSLRTAADKEEAAAAEARRAATPIAAEGVLGEAAGLDDPDEADRLVRAWLSARRQLVSEVRDALTAHAEAVHGRTFAEERVAGDDDVVERRSSARAAASTALAAAVDEYRSAVEVWSGGCAAAGAARVAVVLPAPAEDPAAVRAAVEALASEFGAEHALAADALSRRRAETDAIRAALVEECAQVAAGGLVDPPAPPWRGDRTGRVGAPLWQLVDVAPGAEGTIDGLEAALTGTGLLDAWVGPDGTVDVAGLDADITLVASPVDGPTLADHLVAAGDTAVPDDTVGAVLASVPVRPTVGSAVDASPGEPEVVVGLDGSFRLGAATGRGAVADAEVLGSVARERRRRRRLAELDTAIAEAGDASASLDREEDELARRVAAVVADLNAVPSGGAVDAAGKELDAAGTRLVEAEGRLRASRAALSEAEEKVRGALRALTSLGARHQLPTDLVALAEVEGALATFERTAGVWTRRQNERRTAAHTAGKARVSLERAEAAAGRAAQNLRETTVAAETVAARVATLESTIGAEYEEVLGRIDALSTERTDGQRRRKELDGRRPALDQRIGKLEAVVADAGARRVAAEAERGAAHATFVGSVADGFTLDAAVDIADELDGVTAVLDAARAVLADLGDAAGAEQAVERASSRVDEGVHQTRTALGGRVDLHRELGDHGWWVLRAATGGIRRRVGELADALAKELVDSQAELLAEEEQLFEQVLAGSVRRALADRIRLANQLVDGINHQLAKVRTAAGGVEVKLRWEVDPDQLDAVKAARALLLRDPADLSEQETASLQAFVRARVEQARAELEANAPWEARLRETLDYRAWHRFTLLLGHRDWDGFQVATAKRLQRLSTGERSIALHLPMLASIAAHYADGDGSPSGSPRLILLDELFAGVDATNRAQLFGTFTAWDLDAVFTSDHEWCQYATLDGIAIHHLHPPTGDEPVTSTRFRWDGHQRTLDPDAA